MRKREEIRNFCIIAHIDHGKSTLADRLLEVTGSLPIGSAVRVLDKHPISRERGITIKLAPVSMNYSYQGQNYLLNLIDTPGHVDFSYEVEKTLTAVEGAILLVDASQGVQAQTVNYYQKAREMNLTFIPVINKIDLPTADIERVRLEMMEIFGFSDEEIILVSAKKGTGVEDLLARIIRKIPPPKEGEQITKALIFDSYYDSHRGVIAAVRVFAGELQQGMKLEYYHTHLSSTAKEVGLFDVYGLKKKDKLIAGQIGYLVTGVKDIHQVRVGETVTLSSYKGQPIEGFKRPAPLVFESFYPLSADQFPKMKTAVEQLSLSDSALQWRLENSSILGSGIRLGFLGLLHGQITKERLERDYGLDLIATLPSISYRFKLKNDKIWRRVDNPAKLPPMSEIKEIEEPYIKFNLFSYQEYYGGLLQLLQKKRAKLENIRYIGQRFELEGKMPLGELISDFFNKLEEVTSGFVSFDWQLIGWYPADLVRVEFLINHQVIDGLVFLFPREKGNYITRKLTDRLAEIIPRQQFEVIIQGRLDGRIISKRRIPPFRKDVTAKLYGGDQTRKDKLLEKQKKGKKKLKNIGRVRLPQEAFLNLLKEESD